MSTAIDAHMSMLIQRMGNNSIAEYNLGKVIQHYKDAINSAETSTDATYLSQALESVLSKYGKSLADVPGINNPLLNNQAQVNGKAAGQKGDARDKAIIKDLSDEFGIDVKKRGTTKDWAELAKKDDRVTILDKNGQEVQRDDRVHKGDILVINSQKYGQVKIAVGGDGEINGGDDKVLSVGGQAAANGMMQGLNQLNNLPQQQTQAVTQGIGNLFALGINPENTEAALDPNKQGTQSIFNEQQIKSLLAAILNQSLYGIQQKEQEKLAQGLL